MEGRSNLNKFKFNIFIIFIFVAVIVVLINKDLILTLDMQKINNFIQNQGIYAEIVYLGIYVAKPFFIIMPSNLVALLGGGVFGPVKGFVLSMIGFFISGTIAFYLARFLGKDFVESIMGEKLMKLDDNLEKKGFKILFLLRLPPILPFDPLSYACGLTKIKYSDFILASLLGVVPETICYSMMGKNFTNPLSFKFILPIVVLIIGTILAKPIMNLRKKHK